MNKVIRRTAAIIYLIAFLPGIASATTLFFEDFESDLTQWPSNFSGVIVDDPIEGDKALSFERLWGNGDIFSLPVINSSGHYILSFDYLGTCQTNNCGGFIRTDNLFWQGTTSPYADTLPDTGEWVRLQFAYYGGTSDRIWIEDWIGSGGTWGDAYFDNIELTDARGSTRAVPEPGTLALLGLGLAGLGFRRRQKAA